MDSTNNTSDGSLDAISKDLPEFSLIYLISNLLQLVIYIMYAVRTIILAKRIMKTVNYLCILSFIFVEFLRALVSILMYFWLLDSVRNNC